MVRDVKTRPGADCDTDHQLGMATLKLKLKRPKKKERVNRFLCKGIIPEYRDAAKNRLEALNLEAAVNADDMCGGKKR